MLSPFRYRATDIGRIHHQEQEYDETRAPDNEPRYDETQRPVLFDVFTRDQRAENVAYAGVRVPNAEYETPLALPEPVAQHGDYARPARRLEYTGHRLHKAEVPHGMNIVRPGYTEQITEHSRAQHAQRKKITEVYTLGDEAGREHGYRVCKQKSRVQRPKEM